MSKIADCKLTNNAKMIRASISKFQAFLFLSLYSSSSHSCLIIITLHIDSRITQINHEMEKVIMQINEQTPIK